MAKLKIHRYGDLVLRKKCATVTEITPEIRQLAADMLETMYAAPGVGLAAPQVGLPLRLCVIDVRPDGKKSPLVLINPVLVSGEGKIEEEEGCLSFPGFAAMVKRFDKARVEAVNEKGLPVVVEGSDLLARALQHELDHLDGKMFIDYLTPWKRKRIEQEIRRRKKEGDW